MEPGALKFGGVAAGRDERAAGAVAWREAEAAHRADGTRVNQTPIPNSRTLVRDSRGRRLPHYPWGDYLLEDRELWLFSPYRPNSYDSRYFGPVQDSQVVSVLRPMWTSGR